MTDLWLQISMSKTHFVHDFQSFQQLHCNPLRTRFGAGTKVADEFMEVAILKVLHCDEDRINILKPA
jgi:hypothetical protein